MRQAEIQRDEYVRNELVALAKTDVDTTFDIALLLAEAKENDYTHKWGYNSFGDFLDDSGIDLSEREAYYRIKIIQIGHKKLGIPLDVLKAAKISKLKAIFLLDSEKYPEQIKDLVKQAAAGATLSEIEANVDNLRKEAGEEVFTHRNFKIQKNVAEGVVDPALEKAKRMRGDTLDPESGELKEPSDGQALEDICADFLASVDLHLDAELDAMPDDPKLDDPETWRGICDQEDDYKLKE